MLWAEVMKRLQRSLHFGTPHVHNVGTGMRMLMVTEYVRVIWFVCEISTDGTSHAPFDCIHATVHVEHGDVWWIRSSISTLLAQHSVAWVAARLLHPCRSRLHFGNTPSMMNRVIVPTLSVGP